MPLKLVMPDGSEYSPDEDKPAPPPPVAEEPETANAMTPVLMMVCQRCHAQVAVEVRPMALFLRQDGVLVADVKDESEIMGQAFVVGMPQPHVKCPTCGSSGIVIPNGGLPPNLKL